MGVGFAKDGESSIRNNANQRKYSTDKYYKTKHKYKKGEPLVSKIFSQETKLRLRKKLKKQKKAERIRVFVILTILILFICFLLF